MRAAAFRRAGPFVAAPTTAGGLLRQARQAQGLHIAALAASIKVTPRKLELLESDQFDQLPDATFTRALAQAVCRSLKTDPAPVLALLPPPHGQQRLEEVAEGLKTPFNERPGRLAPKDWMKLSSPAMWIAALFVIAAVVLYVMPAGWIAIPHPGRAASEPAAQAAPPAPEPTPPGAEPVTAEPVQSSTEPAPAAAAPAVEVASATAPAPVKLLAVRTTAPAWIGVTDASGKSLIGRLVQPGENVDLSGALPLTLRIGNANAVKLSFRGQPTDLAKFSKDNVARFQLK